MNIGIFNSGSDAAQYANAKLMPYVMECLTELLDQMPKRGQEVTVLEQLLKSKNANRRQQIERIITLPAYSRPSLKATDKDSSVNITNSRTLYKLRFISTMKSEIRSAMNRKSPSKTSLSDFGQKNTTIHHNVKFNCNSTVPSVTNKYPLTKDMLNPVRESPFDDSIHKMGKGRKIYEKCRGLPVYLVDMLSKRSDIHLLVREISEEENTQHITFVFVTTPSIAVALEDENLYRAEVPVPIWNAVTSDEVEFQAKSVLLDVFEKRTSGIDAVKTIPHKKLHEREQKINIDEVLENEKKHRMRDRMKTNMMTSDNDLPTTMPLDQRDDSIKEQNESSFFYDVDDEEMEAAAIIKVFPKVHRNDDSIMIRKQSRSNSKEESREVRHNRISLTSKDGAIQRPRGTSLFDISHETKFPSSLNSSVSTQRKRSVDIFSSPNDTTKIEKEERKSDVSSVFSILKDACKAYCMTCATDGKAEKTFQTLRIHHTKEAPFSLRAADKLLSALHEIPDNRDSVVVIVGMDQTTLVRHFATLACIYFSTKMEIHKLHQIYNFNQGSYKVDTTFERQRISEKRRARDLRRAERQELARGTIREIQQRESPSEGRERERHLARVLEERSARRERIDEMISDIDTTQENEAAIKIQAVMRGVITRSLIARKRSIEGGDETTVLYVDKIDKNNVDTIHQIKKRRHSLERKLKRGMYPLLSKTTEYLQKTLGVQIISLNHQRRNARPWTKWTISQSRVPAPSVAGNWDISSEDEVWKPEVTRRVFLGSQCPLCPLTYAVDAIRAAGNEDLDLLTEMTLDYYDVEPIQRKAAKIMEKLILYVQFAAFVALRLKLDAGNMKEAGNEIFEVPIKYQSIRTFTSFVAALPHPLMWCRNTPFLINELWASSKGSSLVSTVTPLSHTMSVFNQRFLLGGPLANGGWIADHVEQLPQYQSILQQLMYVTREKFLSTQRLMMDFQRPCNLHRFGSSSKLTTLSKVESLSEKSKIKTSFGSFSRRSSRSHSIVHRRISNVVTEFETPLKNEEKDETKSEVHDADSRAVKVPIYGPILHRDMDLSLSLEASHSTNIAAGWGGLLKVPPIFVAPECLTVDQWSNAAYEIISNVNKTSKPPIEEGRDDSISSTSVANEQLPQYKRIVWFSTSPNPCIYVNGSPLYCPERLSSVRNKVTSPKVHTIQEKSKSTTTSNRIADIGSHDADSHSAVPLFDANREDGESSTQTKGDAPLIRLTGGAHVFTHHTESVITESPLVSWMTLYNSTEIPPCSQPSNASKYPLFIGDGTFHNNPASPVVLSGTISKERRLNRQNLDFYCLSEIEERARRELVHYAECNNGTLSYYPSFGCPKESSFDTKSPGSAGAATTRHSQIFRPLNSLRRGADDALEPFQLALSSLDSIATDHNRQWSEWLSTQYERQLQLSPTRDLPVSRRSPSGNAYSCSLNEESISSQSPIVSPDRQTTRSGSNSVIRNKPTGSDLIKKISQLLEGQVLPTSTSGTESYSSLPKEVIDVAISLLVKLQNLREMDEKSTSQSYSFCHDSKNIPCHPGECINSYVTLGSMGTSFYVETEHPIPFTLQVLRPRTEIVPVGLPIKAVSTVSSHLQITGSDYGASESCSVSQLSKGSHFGSLIAAKRIARSLASLRASRGTIGSEMSRKRSSNQENDEEFLDILKEMDTGYPSLNALYDKFSLPRTYEREMIDSRIVTATAAAQFVARNVRARSGSLMTDNKDCKLFQYHRIPCDGFQCGGGPGIASGIVYALDHLYRLMLMNVDEPLASFVFSIHDTYSALFPIAATCIYKEYMRNKCERNNKTLPSRMSQDNNDSPFSSFSSLNSLKESGKSIYHSLKTGRPKPWEIFPFLLKISNENPGLNLKASMEIVDGLLVSTGTAAFFFDSVVRNLLEPCVSAIDKELAEIVNLKRIVECKDTDLISKKVSRVKRVPKSEQEVEHETYVLRLTRAKQLTQEWLSSLDRNSSQLSKNTKKDPNTGSDNEETMHDSRRKLKTADKKSNIHEVNGFHPECTTQDTMESDEEGIQTVFLYSKEIQRRFEHYLYLVLFVSFVNVSKQKQEKQAAPKDLPSFEDFITFMNPSLRHTLQRGIDIWEAPPATSSCSVVITLPPTQTSTPPLIHSGVKTSDVGHDPIAITGLSGCASEKVLAHFGVQVMKSSSHPEPPVGDSDNIQVRDVPISMGSDLSGDSSEFWSPIRGGISEYRSYSNTKKERKEECEIVKRANYVAAYHPLGMPFAAELKPYCIFNEEYEASKVWRRETVMPPQL